MKRQMEKPLTTCTALALVLNLVGCVANHPLPVRGDESIFAGSVQTDIFPGNHWSYSFGPFQKAENFLNVERAQSNESPRNLPANWADFKPSLRAVGNLGNMGSYFKFDVRWKLKDGREFILENIDVRGISNDYLRKNPIQLQWQRENRSRAAYGDFNPTLSFEVKDDLVYIKWVITITRTPVNHRLTLSGAANRLEMYEEEHVMAALKGKPTFGINFNKTYESRK